MICQLLVVVGKLLDELGAIVNGARVQRMVFPDLLNIHKLAFVVKVLVVMQ